MLAGCCDTMSDKSVLAYVKGKEGIALQTKRKEYGNRWKERIANVFAPLSQRGTDPCPGILLHCWVFVTHRRTDTNIISNDFLVFSSSFSFF